MRARKLSPGKAQAGPDSETELEPSRLTLDRLRDVTGISVWTWYADTDRVFHTAAEVGGTSLDQGVPLKVAVARIHPDDQSRVLACLRAAARNGDVGTFDFCMDLPGHARRHFRGTYFPADHERPGRRIEVIVEDVTRVIRTETALRESVDHYRMAVELNPEIPWLADPEGNILEVGPRWSDLIGVTEAEALGTGWTRALVADDYGPTLRVWQHALDTGEPVDVEYRMLMKTGEPRWMRARAAPRRDADGKIIRWYGTLEDIHERRLAVMALRESEEFSRSILESSDVAIEVLDLDGRLIFINGPGAEIMEVDDPAAIIGRPYESFWPDDVVPVLRDAIAAALAGKTVRHTLFGPTNKGAARWWDFSISPIADAEGRVKRLLTVSRDVTEARHNEAEAIAASRRIANVLESTMDSVISVDLDWRISYMNRRAHSVFPEAGPFIGRDIRDLFDKTETEPFFARYRVALAEHNSVAFEEYLPSVKAWLEVQAYGSAAGLIIFFRDVTERRRAQETIQHLARHDALTGLPNRMQFHERLGAELTGLRAGESLAVLALDLDEFKLINDTLGHRAGDTLLEQVAQRLRSCVGEHGFAARLGGDEFALLMPAGQPEEAATTAQAILDAISRPYDIEGEQVVIGGSIGIAIAPRDGEGADAILHCADLALYRVKATKGRDFRFFEPEMDQALRDRREMKRDLGLALSRGELSLVFQPQIEISSNKLTGFEALLRWQSPTRGAVPPSVFIPLAEESGLIESIGDFVLCQACKEAALWPDHLSVAVNLSPAQFRSKAVHGAVTGALERSHLSPSRLELEITESVLLDEQSGAIAELQALHAAGMRVALDDFGTGYSSLSYLRRFPFDKIKIDRSFVADLPGAENSVAIVRAIIGLGRSMNCRITAEGVETFEQLMFLASEGCEEAQGYLFARPLPAQQARALARTQGGIADRPFRVRKQKRA